MTIPQADGMTRVILRGPGQQITLQTTAPRDPTHAASRRRKRRKPSTRRRPKNANIARRKAPKTNLNRLTCQMVKGQRLQEESPEEPVPCPGPPQVSAIRQLGGGGPRHSETHGPILDPTHPVGPDLEGGFIQDLEA